jgi:hypothetical protein
VATYLFAYAAPVISRLGKRDARGSRGTAVGIDGIALISTFITESIASRVADALHGLRLTGKEKEDGRPRHATTRQQNGEKEKVVTRGPNSSSNRETDRSERALQYP